MSTRAAVGFPLSDAGFEVTPVHSDGYPRGLGKSIFTQQRKGWTEEQFRAFLFEEHPGPFRSLYEADWSKRPASGCGPICGGPVEVAEQAIMKFRWIGPETPHAFELFEVHHIDGDDFHGLQYLYLITKTGLMAHQVFHAPYTGELPQLSITTGVMTEWTDEAALRIPHWDQMSVTLADYADEESPHTFCSAHRSDYITSRN